MNMLTLYAKYEDKCRGTGRTSELIDTTHTLLWRGQSVLVAAHDLAFVNDLKNAIDPIQQFNKTQLDYYVPPSAQFKDFQLGLCARFRGAVFPFDEILIDHHLIYVWGRQLVEEAVNKDMRWAAFS